MRKAGAAEVAPEALARSPWPSDVAVMLLSRSVLGGLTRGRALVLVMCFDNRYPKDLIT